MDKITIDQLNELEKKFNKDLDDEVDREKLYDDQAEDIASRLMYMKVDDGYYIWTYCRSQMKSNVYYVAAARKMMIGLKGYKPMIAEFEPDPEKTTHENLRDVVRMMLKKQNGEYDESSIEVKE